MMDLIGQGYALVLNYEADSAYYLWDVLTTLSTFYPELVETKEELSSVYVDGARAGRTYKDPNGRKIDLVTKADKDKFFAIMDKLGKEAKLQN